MRVAISLVRNTSEWSAIIRPGNSTIVSHGYRFPFQSIPSLEPHPAPQGFELRGVDRGIGAGGVVEGAVGVEVREHRVVRRALE